MCNTAGDFTLHYRVTYNIDIESTGYKLTEYLATSA